MIKKFFNWLGDLLFSMLDDEPINDDYISEYFTLAELVKSDTAIRHGIVNEPNSQQLNNLKMVSRKILDPVREKFGAFSPFSGFRSKELNTLIGGASNSQHMKGEAVDFEIPGVDNLKVFNWIKDNLDYDQLILEYYEEGFTNSGWIHVSYNVFGNRKESFKIN